MAEKEVDAKNKRKNTLSEMRIQKKFTERSRAKDDEVSKDEDGLKGDLAKSRRSKAVENAKVKNDFGGRDRVLTRRNSARGGGILDEKAKGDTSLVKKSGSAIGVKFGRGENAANKKVVAEEGSSGKVRTPAKRRRNVEKEIAEKIVSSNEKSSYNLRARKQIPSFRKVDLSESGFDQVVGKRVKAFWSGSREWYTGKIEFYDDKKKRHKIVYEDGDVQELDLKKQRFELEVMPDEAYTLSSKHEHMAGNKEIVDGDLINADSVEGSSRKASDADPAKKYSKPTKKVVTKAVKNGGSELLKREDTAKRRSSRLQKGEDIDDGDMIISEIVKKVRLKTGDTEPEKTHSKLRRKEASHVPKKWGSRSQKWEDMDEMKEVEKNLKQGKTMATKAAKERGSKSQKRRRNEDETSEDVSSQKTVSNAVSDAQTQVLQKTKVVGGQIDVGSRKNPIRKGRANFKTGK